MTKVIVTLSLLLTAAVSFAKDEKRKTDFNRLLQVEKSNEDLYPVSHGQQKPQRNNGSLAGIVIAAEPSDSKNKKSGAPSFPVHATSSVVHGRDTGPYAQDQAVTEQVRRDHR